MIGFTLSNFINKAAITDKRQVKYVAIVTKNLRYHDAVTAGICTMLAKEERVRFIPVIYHTDPRNKINEDSVVEKVLDKKPDIVVAVGAGLAQIAKGVIAKRAPQTPLIFAGASNPTGLGLVYSDRFPGCNVTGTASLPEDPALNIRLLLELLPDIKRIALPYCTAAGPDIELAALAVKDYCHARGVDVMLMPIEANQAGLFMIQGILASVDLVMYVQGCFVGRISDGIAKLCKQYGKIFYAAEPWAAIDGEAPFAFGARGENVGKAAAKQVTKVLIDRVPAGTIPVHYVERNHKLIINCDTLEELQITPAKDLLLLMSRGILIKNGKKW